MELPVEPSKPGTATEYDVDPDEDSEAVATQAAGKETYKRVLKSTTTEKHSYIYASGKLLRETITGNGAAKILDFQYDQSGAPYSLTYTVGSNSTIYYYITNLQGDVMFLVDSKGNQVAAYTYDPYGRVLTATGTMAEINPLRYRGYYQDSETGFYYLQSRYYDPAICRFINADSYASTGQGLIGYNAFAYCGNDPIDKADDEGGFWHIVIGAAAGAIISGVAKVITNAVEGKKWNSELGTAMLAGAAGGALAASGVGAVGMIVGNATISMAENAANQISANKGIGDFNVGDMLFDGAIGGIMGAIGGPGKGSNHYTKLGKQVISRTIDALSHDGIQSGIREAGKAFAYYGKNMAKYYAQFVHGLASDMLSSLTSSIITSSIAKGVYYSTFS